MEIQSSHDKPENLTVRLKCMAHNQDTSPASDAQKNVADILTDESAASYIGGIEPRTVRAWRTCRGLPFLRITPKVIRIRRCDLDKWLARQQVAITRGAQ